MRIATWNINSLKARQDRVEQWLSEVQPDVLCLQETKLADSAFPALAFSGLGYDSVHVGQGQWNGVAILSKVGLESVHTAFQDGQAPDAEARLVTATCGGVVVTSVYVPNGRSLDDDHYQYKLAWLARLQHHLRATTPAGAPAVVCGDFNIAPEDRDVHNPAAFANATHTSPAERTVLAELAAEGWYDTFRALYPQPQLYSWWDYRAGDFHQGRGLRIDLVLANAALVGAVQWAVVDRNARKGTQPSDHAPVVVDLAVPAA